MLFWYQNASADSILTEEEEGQTSSIDLRGFAAGKNEVPRAERKEKRDCPRERETNESADTDTTEGGPVEYEEDDCSARSQSHRLLSVSATGDRPIREGRRVVPGPRTRRSEEEEDRDTIRDATVTDGRAGGRTDVGI